MDQSTGKSRAYSPGPTVDFPLPVAPITLCDHQHSHQPTTLATYAMPMGGGSSVSLKSSGPSTGLPHDTWRRWHVRNVVVGGHLSYEGDSRGVVGTYGRLKRGGESGPSTTLLSVSTHEGRGMHDALCAALSVGHPDPRRHKKKSPEIAIKKRMFARVP